MMDTNVENWLQVYLERQKIVHEAMRQLRPDLLTIAEAQNRERMIEGLMLRESYSSFPFSGIWKDSDGEEWNYFVHGLGCRLVKMDSGEPVEWDAPDVTTFHDEWFINWVNWYLKGKEQHSEIDPEFITQSIKELIDIGVIRLVNTRSGHKYQLVYKGSKS